MKEVLVRTDQKTHLHSLYQTAALYLQANSNYELAMVNLESNYSFANIREGDNYSFKWSADNGKTWTLSTCLQDVMN